MKFAGLLALCSALSLTGVYFFRLHNKRLKLLKLLSEFFYAFADYIKLSGNDVSDCIKRIMLHEEFSSLRFPSVFSERFDFGCDARGLWSECINSDKELFDMSKAARELLLSFQECFGKIPLGVFSEKCEGYGKRFFALYEKEEALWEKNKTLFLSSGVLAAAAVFLILI